MAEQYLIPGFGQVQEEGEDEYLIPGYGQMSNNLPTATLLPSVTGRGNIAIEIGFHL